MSCPRCEASTAPAPGAAWCEACEGDYQDHARAQAGELVAPILIGSLVIAVGGIALPILGHPAAVIAAVFGGFGTFVGMARLRIHRRRQRFLRAPLPQARLQPGR
jgi:hypothetical protein